MYQRMYFSILYFLLTIFTGMLTSRPSYFSFNYPCVRLRSRIINKPFRRCKGLFNRPSKIIYSLPNVKSFYTSNSIVR